MSHGNHGKKIDIYALLKNTMGMHGFVYIIFLIAIIVLGLIYMNNVSDIAKTQTGFITPIPDSLKNVADLPMKKGTTSPPVDISLFRVSNDALLSKGKELYATQCVTCHGEQGLGNGPAGATLNPPPRNFTKLDGWTNGPSFDMIYKTLHEGITSRGMASYAHLSPEDRFAMIHYIRSFAAFPPITDAEVQKIEEMYQLSKGVKESNQIPVKLAMEKMISEYKPKADKINGIVYNINNSSDSSAVLLKELSSDLTTTVTALSSNLKWNESENEFVNFIIANQIGFKGETTGLPPQQLSRLFNYLKSIFAQAQI